MIAGLARELDDPAVEPVLLHQLGGLAQLGPGDVHQRQFIGS